MQKGVEKYVEENASMEIKYARNLFRPSGGVNHPGSWIQRARFKSSPGSPKGILLQGKPAALEVQQLIFH